MIANYKLRDAQTTDYGTLQDFFRSGVITGPSGPTGYGLWKNLMVRYPEEGEREREREKGSLSGYAESDVNGADHPHIHSLGFTLNLLGKGLDRFCISRCRVVSSDGAFAYACYAAYGTYRTAN